MKETAFIIIAVLSVIFMCDYITTNSCLDMHGEEFKIRSEKDENRFQAHRPQMTSRRIVVVMSDSRTIDEEGYHFLAFKINRLYAMRHGYEMKFTQTSCYTNGTDRKLCASCAHAEYGPRASSW